MVDARELFVRATYKREGDGPLALCTYENIQKFYATVQTQHFRNMLAVARLLTTNTAMLPSNRPFSSWMRTPTPAYSLATLISRKNWMENFVQL